MSYSSILHCNNDHFIIIHLLHHCNVASFIGQFHQPDTPTVQFVSMPSLQLHQCAINNLQSPPRCHYIFVNAFFNVHFNCNIRTFYISSLSIHIVYSRSTYKSIYIYIVLVFLLPFPLVSALLVYVCMHCCLPHSKPNRQQTKKKNSYIFRLII